MHVGHVRHSFLIAVLLVFAGCGGTGSPAAPSTLPAGFVHRGTPVASFSGNHVRGPLHSVMPSYDAKGWLVFEGDQEQTAVNVYTLSGARKNSAPIGTIKVQTGCPYGLTMDKKGTLYVADNCAVGDVEEYPKGSTTESVAITDGISYPLGLAMDDEETLYVSNYPAAITEYKHGATSPFQTITGQGLEDPFGLTLNRHGDLFIADFGAAQVFEVAKGTTNVTPLNLEDLVEPIGVAVDKKTGFLWVTDGQGNKINVYEPGNLTPHEEITGQGNPYAISTCGVICYPPHPYPAIFESDTSTKAIYGYMEHKYKYDSTLTDGISLPTGVLVAKP
ncbi:MAG TPA: hypothetical protein VKR56_05845 [Candidatus Cybelea sp.]|nr:hypothetical protein [Candidatus Cybelea sp.]